MQNLKSSKHYDAEQHSCLNINNKDYKLIESFIGTPRSKQKPQEIIGKLEPQKAIINIIEPQIIKINQFWQTLKEKGD